MYVTFVNTSNQSHIVMRNLSHSAINNLYVETGTAYLPYQQHDPSAKKFFPVPSSSLQVSFLGLQGPEVGEVTDEAIQPIVAEFSLYLSESISSRLNYALSLLYLRSDSACT